MDPALRALGQAETIGHRAPPGDQDAQVRPLVAIVAGLEDAQEERFALALDGAAVIIEAVEHHPAVPEHAVDAAFRRPGDDVDAVLGVLGHQRADDGALPGGAGLDRRAAAVDPFHHLDLALADDLVLVAAEIGLRPDEEGGVAAVAEGRLQHQVVVDPGLVADLAQMRVVPDLRERVRHRRHAGLVADAHGLDLVVAAGAQLGLGEPDLGAQLLGQFLGLLVEHQEDELRPAAAPIHQVDDILVLEQVVVDVLDRLELGMGFLGRREDVRMAPVEAVQVIDFGQWHGAVHRVLVQRIAVEIDHLRARQHHAVMVRLVAVAVDQHDAAGAHQRLHHDLVAGRGAVGGKKGLLGAEGPRRQSLRLLDGAVRLQQAVEPAGSRRGLGQEDVGAVAINRDLFNAYVETQLAPTLKPGDVVIPGSGPGQALDNLSSHKSTYAAEVLKSRGASFLFLPPPDQVRGRLYSPDPRSGRGQALNPIEMAFAKLKALIRKAAARSYDALWQAVGAVCDLFSDEECYNYFKAAGYEAD